jgi:hypothetical protein
MDAQAGGPAVERAILDKAHMDRHLLRPAWVDFSLNGGFHMANQNRDQKNTDRGDQNRQTAGQGQPNNPSEQSAGNRSDQPNPGYGQPDQGGDRDRNRQGAGGGNNEPSGNQNDRRSGGSNPGQQTKR